MVLDGLGRPVRRPADWRALTHRQICEVPKGRAANPETGELYWSPLGVVGFHPEMVVGRMTVEQAERANARWSAVCVWSDARARWEVRVASFDYWSKGFGRRLALAASRHAKAPPPWSRVRIVERSCTLVQLGAYVDGLAGLVEGRLYDDGHALRVLRRYVLALRWEARRGLFGPLKATGCWCHAGVWSDDYETVDVGGRRVGLHRLMYEYQFGPLPEGFEVAHTCDVRACFRPSHLFVATHAENMADMARKGRAFRRGVTTESVLQRDWRLHADRRS